MPELITPDQVVSEARTWIKTRWRHQGRRKRINGPGGYLGAVDCVGLVVGVVKALGLPISYEDRTDYPPNPDGLRLRETLESFLTEARGELRPGYVVLFRKQGDSIPTHVGIVGDYPGGPSLSLIHAYLETKAVVEHRFDSDWLSLLVCSYLLPGVAY